MRGSRHPPFRDFAPVVLDKRGLPASTASAGIRGLNGRPRFLRQNTDQDTTTDTTASTHNNIG